MVSQLVRRRAMTIKRWRWQQEATGKKTIKRWLARGEQQ
jgi:hypothetical protein